MVKDINKIIQNLLDFYDFRGKTIVSVGAGGGQFVAYARSAKHVIAIDNDKYALERLRVNISKLGLSDKFTLVHADFNNIEEKGDVVLFEFCLHEMSEPERMIEYAYGIADDIVIADHGINSEWAYIADEKDKAEYSWADVEKFSIEKKVTHETEQLFGNYDELYDKVKIQGENSIERINKYIYDINITIPMSYTFALLTADL